MTSIPTSVAISSLSNNLVPTNQQLTATSTLQIPNSCVSLVSTNTNGNQSLSIPISISRSNLTTATNTQTTMSWTPTPIQFAAQRPNGTISFVPQQATTVYQMPNDTIQLPTQTMLITQPSSRPPDQQTTNQNNTQQTGSIVQIMTPNGPAQLLTTTPTNLKQQTIAVNNANNLISSTSSNSNNNKQILPKGGKASNSKSKNKNNSNRNNNNNSNNSNNNNLINTNTLSTPTINNLNNLNQTINQPQIMLNTGGQSGFFTSNGNLFFNQALPFNQPMGQQFIVNSQQTPNKTQILIPSSPANNQLKNQNLIQPTTVLQPQPQLIQLPNGQMILVQPQAQPQTSSSDTLTLTQNFNSPQLQLISQPTNNNGDYSTGGNFIITSQSSSNSSFVNTNLMTTGTNNIITNNSTTNSTTTTNSTKAKTTRKKQPAKKDNKNNSNNNNTSTTTMTTVTTLNNKIETTTDVQKSKGLNLADLLKEAGIMDSPPSSPTTQFNQTTTDLNLMNPIDQNINTLNNSNTNTTQLTTLDLNNSTTSTTAVIDPTQQSTLLNNSTVNNNQLINQPTMVMLPTASQPNPNQIPGTNYFFNPLTGTAAPTNTTQTVNNNNQTAPQFKLAFASDGTFILQTVPTFAQPSLTTNNQIVQSKFVDTKDSLNSGSSQPSPDSTTPTLDSTPTSCSSITVTTSTISFTANQNTTTSTNSLINSQLGPIKIADSIPLQTIGGDQLSTDKINNNSQTLTTTPTNKKNTKAKKATANKKQQQATPKNNIVTQAPTQQLITIPVQTTNLNSSLNSNSVLPNSIILNSSNSVQQQATLTANNQQQLQTTTQSGVPLMQISVNNQEFSDRLDGQVNYLSSLKTLTKDQESLLQELIGLQKKISLAKSSAENGSGDGNIILTTQPMVPQQPINSTDLNKLPNQTLMTPIDNKLTKDNTSSTNNLNTTPILAFKKLGDQNKPATQIFIQTSPNTSTNSNLNNTNQVQDPAATKNTFEGQKIKILTTTNPTTSNQTIQLGNQFFTITTPGKVPLQNLTTNQLNTDGTSTQTVYQVVHLQSTSTNTLNNIDTLTANNNTTSKLIKLNDQTTTAIKSELDKKAKFNKLSFQQQLNADIAAASKPDCKTPFKNCSDACKRLLRYHVFNQPDIEEEKLNKFDDDFEKLSQFILYKKEKLYRRFQFNILKLSMKTHSIAENIMLDKVFIEQEKESLKEDKEFVEKGNILELPEPPFELKEKIRQEVDEELSKEQEQNKKRKLDDLLTPSDDSTSTTIKKLDTTTVAVDQQQQQQQIHETEDEEEDSEQSVNEEESNDINEFNKYLGNLNPIDDLSPLYNSSNSYNTPIMQSQHHHHHHHHHHQQDNSNSFNQLFDFGDTAIRTNKEDFESSTAVESILDEHLNNQLIDDHPLNNDQQHNNLYHQTSSVQKNGQLVVNNDPQMESAINSILDICLDPQPTNSTTSNENGLLLNSNNSSSSDQLSSNGYNFTSNSQLNFSQSNSYTMSINSLNNRTNLINDYGSDEAVLDEAIKSIL